jgi:hypothetical protein
MGTPLTDADLNNILSMCKSDEQLIVGYFLNSNPNYLPLAAIDRCTNVL